jgi:predicted XRE-type DNA-binding protein
MRKRESKALVARSAVELASVLGLTPAGAMEIEVRSALNDKIIQIVARHGLTHAQVAKIAGTSRTRITAILNRNTRAVSADLLPRILGRLGFRAKLSFSKVA